MRETEILVEQQPPQGVLVRGHAGLVINKLSQKVETEGSAPSLRPVPSRLSVPLRISIADSGKVFIPGRLNNPNRLYALTDSNRCRATSVDGRQSRPDSGLGFQVKACKTIVLFPLRSEAVGNTQSIHYSKQSTPNAVNRRNFHTPCF